MLVGENGTRSLPATYEAWSDQQLSVSRRVYRGAVLCGASSTAFLTAFYTFRAFALTFYGPQRVPAQAGHHATNRRRSWSRRWSSWRSARVLVGLHVLSDPHELREPIGSSILSATRHRSPPAQSPHTRMPCPNFIWPWRG